MDAANKTEPAAEVEQQSRKRKGRWRLLMLVLVTASPVLASYFTYYVLQPKGSPQYGELISPVRELPRIEVIDVQGNKIDLRSLRGQWLMITVADAACDAACEKVLYLTRQLHTGLGAERDRLDRVWFATGAAPIPEGLPEALQGATVLRVDSEQLSQWLVPQAQHPLQESIYLVDPQGFWMMRFPATADVDNAMKIKKTLNRLLRAAQFWDRPGR
jgi:hypothetical protein